MVPRRFRTEVPGGSLCTVSMQGESDKGSEGCTDYTIMESFKDVLYLDGSWWLIIIEDGYCLSLFHCIKH
jgi:hypothetical protein